MRLFCALWDTRSVTRTAEQLGLSQSSVSAGLGRLRAIFGDPLFIWDGHAMVPTPRTLDIIDDTRRLLLALEALVEQRAPGVMDLRRHFVIASADYVAALCGPELTDRCAREAPGLVLEFVDVKPDMLDKGTAVGIDFFLMPASRLRTEGLRSASLYTDQYVCAGRPDNAALQAAADDAEAFLALPHVGYSSVQRVVSSHESKAWRPDHWPAYRMLGPHYLAAGLIAARSQSVAILPARAVATLGLGEGLTMVRPPAGVRLPEIEMTLYWSEIAERDPAHRWMRDALAAVARRAPIDESDSDIQP